jgi:tetratricopeptide (TPR) repeat protein
MSGNLKLLKPEKPQIPQEALVFMDDDTWIWELTANACSGSEHRFVKTPSTMIIRQSWNRFRATPFIIVHWECKFRGGGAIIEEILDIDRRYDVANKVIIITTNPIHEDVVYFSELGVRRIVRARHRERDMAQSADEIRQHIRDIIAPQSKATIETLWRKITVALDRLTENASVSLLDRIEENIKKLRDPSKPVTARELEALGCVEFRRGHNQQAISLLNQAIQINPNYFRAWNTLIDVKRAGGEHQEAYALLLKMQMHNRASIRRLVALGEEQLALKDHRRAETYFKGALDKDGWCAGALNGLAEVKFEQGELDEARGLLAKSTIAYKFAVKLNLHGIELVKKGAYAAALEHYSRAQYVLPQQEKGPQLLYNIALCYAKWGRMPMAEEFLKLALIKEPNYKKASKLLDQVKAKQISGSESLLSVA